MVMGETALLGRTLEELRRLATSLGEPAFRGDQMYRWIYRQKALSLSDMTSLPISLRRKLTDACGAESTSDGDVDSSPCVPGLNPPVHSTVSKDGTKKYLFPTQHGGHVEAALIPDRDRLTLCLSTQIGCRRGCLFCQTARQGFQGNLSPGEIVNQYHALPERDAVTNIVYMGMGEPLDNFESTITSLELLTDEEGYGLGRRRITLSTVGIHPELERFLERSPVNLAISLHTPFPEERRRIMPVENANPIERTIGLVRQRREDRRRRISFEYTMFAGVNDTPRHADGIARLLNGLSVRINLIPFHPIPGTELQPSDFSTIERFRDVLRAKGIPTFIRSSRGQDINAACGLLWTRHIETPRS